MAGFRTASGIARSPPQQTPIVRVGGEWLGQFSIEVNKQDVIDRVLTHGNREPPTISHKRPARLPAVLFRADLGSSVEDWSMSGNSLPQNPAEQTSWLACLAW